MPEPGDGESRADFISRCIPIVLNEGTAQDQDQATAICSQIWRDRDKMSDKNIKRGLAEVKSVDIEERSVTAAISTIGIDRDREVLLPRGAKIENFLSNPVVLWSHDSFSPPVGKALWVKKGTKKITAKVQFAITERAEEIWQLFKGGFLKAFSVGFDPIAHRAPTPADIKKNPELAEVRRIFTEWELLEFSAVAVPANPEALATAVKQHDIELSKDLLEDFEQQEEMDDIEIELEELVSLEPSIKLEELVVLEPFHEVDVKGVVLEEIKKRKGIMF